MEKPIRTGRLDTTLGELAVHLGGTIDGPPELVIECITSADSGDPHGIAFAESDRYVTAAVSSGVGALLLAPKTSAQGLPSIRVADPRMAFFSLLQATDHPMPINLGIHPTALVDPSAIVEEGAQIGPFVVIEADSIIRSGARIYSGAYIGPHCEVEADAILLPHAVLVRNVTIGARSTIHAGAVLGTDGFGFVWDGIRRVKIPQVGRVVVGEDVEVGSLSAVDRATSGATTIGRGTKIDNLVQVAHNVTIGEDGAIAGLSGIAGSARVGNRVVLGGQSAVSDHVQVGDDITVGARGGVASDLLEPGTYLDSPAHEYKTARRNMILKTKLVDLLERIRDLESKVAELEAKRQ